MNEHPAGWAPDPVHRAQLRFWDGARWTGWLSDGWYAVWQDQEPIVTAVPDDARVRFVAETLLPAATVRGLVTAQQVDALVGLSRELTAAPVVPTPAVAPPVMAPAAAAQPVAGGWQPATAPWQPGPTLPVAGHRAAAAPGVGGRPDTGPSALQRARTRFSSELAVHGLAYLGVLLLFAGLFGLVAFAFGDVAPALRPVAELGSVLVPFLAAAVLLRQGAVVVGRAMEGLGALLAPLMVVTSLVDGFGFPPEAAATGVAPLVLAGACLLVAAAQVLWVRRRPGSGVRYAVAPTGWLAAAMATIAVGRPMPSGQSVATPSAEQVAAMAIAVALTAVAARGRHGPLGRAASATVLPGTVAMLALGVVTAVAQDWPMLPVVLTLLACAIAWDRCVPRLPGPVADSLIVAAVLLAAFRVVAGPLESRPLRVAAMLATTALLLAAAEVMVRRARSSGARLAAILGLGAGTAGAVMVLAGDTGLVAAWAWSGGAAVIVTGWALRTRRTVDRHTALSWLAGAGQALLVLAAGMDGGAGAALLVAVGLLVLAGPAGRPPALTRGADDRFWSMWWTVLAVGAVLGTAARTVSAVTGPTDAGTRATLVAAFVGLLLAVLLGPLPVTPRTWLSTAIGWWGWLALAQVYDLPQVWWAAGLAVAALGLLVAAQLTERSVATVPLGGAAHATALLALPLARDASVPAAWATFAAVWLVTAVGVDRGTGPWHRITAPLGRAAGPAAWVIGLLALPVTASATVHVTRWLVLADPWRGLPFLVLATVYCVATRFPGVPDRSAVTGVLAPLGYALAVVGTSLAGSIAAAALGLGVLAAVPVLVRPGRRPVVAVWTAWWVLPAFAWTTVRALDPDGWWATAWPLAAAALIGVGGATVVGVLLLGSARPVRRPWPPDGPTVPALTAGGASLVLGTAAAVLSGCLAPSTGWAVLIGGAAAVLLVAGVLTVLAPLLAAALVLVWVGAQVLHAGPFDATLQLGLVAALLASAQLVSRRPHTGWNRPDAWLALTAVPAYLVGLSLALDDAGQRPDDRVPQLAVAGAGLLLVATAVRLRRRPPLAEALGWAGTAVLLIGSALAGAGWPALTLTLTGVAHTTLAAVVSRGTARTVRQVVGAVAALGAWGALLTWISPGAGPGSDLTLGLGALTLMVLAVLVTRPGIARSWVAVWGAVAAVLGLGALGAVLVGTAPADGWQVAALVVAAAAVVVLDRRWGPDLAAVLLLAAVQIGLLAAGVGAATAVGLLVGASAVTAVGQVLVRATPVARRCATELGAGLLVLATVQLSPPAADGTAGPTSAAALLAGIAVQSGAAGVAWRSLSLRLAARVLAWTAWAVLVGTGLTGAGAGWYTVALGLALLTVVALWRADRRHHGQVLNPPGLGALEVTALAFCVLSPFVDAFTAGVWHALVMTAMGIVALLWGLATRVRRRLFTGAVIVLIALVLAVGLPLVAILPPWGGVWAWLTLAAFGLLAVGAATLVEKGRAAARTARERFGSMTAGWE